ncbi:MAG: TolC family protein [Burkholderiales bacterium]|nr:TolC family protein [Burkholderiales bacterium]MCE1177006.1 TolC family protein [Burkholderiales bacterium]
MYILYFRGKDRYKRGFKKNVFLRMMAFLCLMMQIGSVSADVLDELIVQSIRSYPSIKSKEMGQKSAQTDVTSAKLGFLPTASVSYEPRRLTYGGSAYTADAAKDAYTAIVVTQPLFGGGLVSNYRQSKANLGAADWALREEAENVALRVINAYVSWFLANKKVQAAQESVNEHKHFVDLITRRVEAGASPTTDQNLGVSRLLQAKSELASFLSMEATALTTLNQLLGRRLTSEELLRQPLENEKMSFSDDVVMQAMSIHPSIKRLEYVAESMRQASKVQRAQAFPQLVLRAKREFGSLTASNVSPSTTIGIAVSYTTGAGLSSLSKASAAYNRYQAAMMDVEVAKRDLIVKVNQDVSDYIFAKNRIEGLAKNVELTKTVSQSYDRLFLVGKKSWLDLMNTVRERKDIQISLADAQAQVLATSRRLRIYTQGLDFESLGLFADESSDLKSFTSTSSLKSDELDTQLKAAKDVGDTLISNEKGVPNTRFESEQGITDLKTPAVDNGN